MVTTRWNYDKEPRMAKLTDTQFKAAWIAVPLLLAVLYWLGTTTGVARWLTM